MLTAALRDLHKCYPGRFLTDVRTACSDLWENNPYISVLSEEDSSAEVIQCSYPLINRANYAPYHCLHGFIEFLNQQLGLSIKPTAFKGDIHLSPQEKAWYSQVQEFTRKPIPFWIVAAGGKYDVPIKWWSTERYQKVIDHFRGRLQFVQVGQENHHHPKLEGAIDLRGQTTLRELIRLVYHAQGVLCSVTALMHLAAAVETRKGASLNRPCVVIAGGREPAHWEAYPDHQFIHTNGALACCSAGGCWKDRVHPLRDGDKRDAPSARCVNVAGDLPRCMDMISPEEVIRKIEIYFTGGRLRRLSRTDQMAASRGIAATKSNPFDNGGLNIHSAGMACERQIKNLPNYEGVHSGRGIVICGGGTRYFPSAWVCINMLRRLGCALPIELWYLGPLEMTAQMISMVTRLNVECIDALKRRESFPARRLGGWELKAYVIIHSRFREVLLLDADNVPVIDPEYLFGESPFLKTGAVFWPDYPHASDQKSVPIWRSCGLRKPREPEFESGQIVVDKKRCWDALQLALWFNENSDFYYRYLHGDKETFHLAFRKLKKSYSLVNTPIHTLRGTMCQHDFEGKRVFQHRNVLKWTLEKDNPRVKGFWWEQECLDYLESLRETSWKHPAIKQAFSASFLHLIPQRHRVHGA